LLYFSLLNSEIVLKKDQLKKGIIFGMHGETEPLEDFNPDESNSFNVITMYNDTTDDALVAYMDFFRGEEAKEASKRIEKIDHTKEYDGKEFMLFEHRPDAVTNLAMAIALMAQQYYTEKAKGL